jgi:hypothetical protein
VTERVYSWTEDRPETLPAKLVGINFSAATRWVRRKDELILHDGERGEVFYGNYRVGLAHRFADTRLPAGPLTREGYWAAKVAAADADELVHL